MSSSVESISRKHQGNALPKFYMSLAVSGWIGGIYGAPHRGEMRKSLDPQLCDTQSWATLQKLRERICQYESDNSLEFLTSLRLPCEEQCTPRIKLSVSMGGCNSPSKTQRYMSAVGYEGSHILQIEVLYFRPTSLSNHLAHCPHPHATRGRSSYIYYNSASGTGGVAIWGGGRRGGWADLRERTTQTT